MSRLNPMRLKPLLPYWACIALWAAFGPLGAAPAACRRWGRACLEAGLTLAGLLLLSGPLLLEEVSIGGQKMGASIANGLVDSSSWPWQAAGSALMFSMALGLWVSDLWRIRAWHGRKFDPLLDSTTEM